MFPNNVEFFVREKETERQAEIKQIELGRFVRQRPSQGRRRLAQLIFWLGSQLIAWADKLQVQPTASPVSEQS